MMIPRTACALIFTATMLPLMWGGEWGLVVLGCVFFIAGWLVAPFI